MQIVEQEIGSYRGGELQNRAYKLCPELANLSASSSEYGKPWFTGWKCARVAGQYTDHPTAYNDEGYCGQWCVFAPDDRVVVVNMPGFQIAVIHGGETFDIGDERLLPEISDKDLQAMFRVGFQLVIQQYENTFGAKTSGGHDEGN